MRPSYVLFYVVFVMLSCGTLFSSKGDLQAVLEAPKSATASAATCPQQQTIIDLIANLEKCEAQIKECMPSTITIHAASDYTTRPHVVVRYETKACADAGPVIEPVPSTKCLNGQLCLDNEGQRILAKNIVAYEAWVQRVKNCESK